MIESNIHEFQPLYARSSKGKVKYWHISVQIYEGDPAMIIEHGYLDGKKQTDIKSIRSGKNLGKANATTAWDQAVSQAKSKWVSQKDKNYVESIDDIDNVAPNILPMCAQPYADRKHYITFPCFVQPKMNGVRCLTRKEEEIIYSSRGGKPVPTLVHLNEYVNNFMSKILDGEVYIHGEDFQTIVSLFKKIQDMTKELQYWIYDIADTKMIFEERNKWIIENIPQNHPFLKIVPTYKITKPNEVKLYHDKFVQEGFEGVIVRNINGLYQFDHRSNDLQKYKEFFDSEFIIVGGHEKEDGRERGCVIFEVALDDNSGRVFNVRPRGTVARRRKWLTEIKSLIGKQLTVRWQERSQDNVPIFPVGIAIRDYE